MRGVWIDSKYTLLPARDLRKVIGGRPCAHIDGEKIVGTLFDADL